MGKKKEVEEEEEEGAAWATGLISSQINFSSSKFSCWSLEQIHLNQGIVLALLWCPVGYTFDSYSMPLIKLQSSVNGMDAS